MNIYDNLNDLTKTLSESKEFLRFKQAAEKIDENPTHASMIKDFMSAQFQITAAKMMNQEPSAELIESFNALYSTIANISDVSEFLNAQQQLSTILNDISTGISNAVSVDAEFLKTMPEFPGIGDE